MTQPPIRFDNGSAYERGMGVWSRLAGEVFLDWLAPPQGMRWIDIGCGSGAFTELTMQRCAPAETHGIDPSEPQLAFARTRPGAAGATFHQGDAMALPFEADRFDAAIMALVIFFVPEPAKGVAEMARVVRPGGTIAAYAWDVLNGGFPFEPLQAEFRALGVSPSLPPSRDPHDRGPADFHRLRGFLERHYRHGQHQADPRRDVGCRCGPIQGTGAGAPAGGRGWKDYLRRAGERGEGARARDANIGVTSSPPP